jgi:hypothetical protein
MRRNVVFFILKTKFVVPEPEGSSPHSQQPASGPYPEPGESTPHPPQPVSLRSIWSHPSTPWSSKWSFSFGLSHQNPVHVSPLSNACHMPSPPPPLFDLPNHISWWVFFVLSNFNSAEPEYSTWLVPCTIIRLLTMAALSQPVCLMSIFMTFFSPLSQSSKSTKCVRLSQYGEVFYIRVFTRLLISTEFGQCQNWKLSIGFNFDMCKVFKTRTIL